MRIFVSSPSDVAAERKIALQVIGRLHAEFKHHFPVHPVLWEHEPLLATEHFQEGLVSPAECDIVVYILWSSLGSPLPAERFTREDGSTGVTGTEWEYLIAAQQHAKSGQPEILFYRRQSPVQVDIDDQQALARAQHQRQQVNEFFLRHFHNADAEHTFKNAYWSFTSIDEFESMVYTHLSGLLKKHLSQAQTDSEEEAVEVIWHQGSPFMGLRSFNLEHAEIYFGRNRARNELFNQFRQQVADHQPFVMVLGTSGSGKSSLVKAGLLPMLLSPGVLSGVGECRWCVYKPSDDPADLTAGLLAAITGDTCLPELRPSPAEHGALLARVHDSPHALEALIYASLNGIKQRVGYRDEVFVRLVIVIDQFEELFTLPGIADSDRLAFVSLLSSLARSEHSFVIGTMRSDFFARCEALPELIDLMRGHGQFHLPPPSADEIGQMIALPAKTAGLSFEHDEDGIGLDDKLRHAAARQPNILPLLSFTLDQLFEQRDGNRLTYAAYTALGGMEGAITRRADEVFNDLHEAARAELPQLLRALVIIRDDAGESIGARRAPWRHVAASPARQQLADAFIAARLLAIEGDIESGDASIAVTHEALLRNWARARDWVAENMEFLRARTRIATTARYWQLEDRTDSLLLPEGRLLTIARQLLAGADSALEDEVRDYIRASISRLENMRQAGRRALAAKRRARKRGLYAAGVAALIVAAAAAFIYQGRLAREELDRLASQRASAAARGKITALVNMSEEQTRSGDFLSGIQLGLEADRQERNSPGEQPATASPALYQALWAQPATVKFAAAPRVAGSYLLSRPLFSLDSGARRQTAFPGDARVLASAGGERVLLTLADGTPRLADPGSGRTIATFPIQSGSLGLAGAFSADGGHIVVFGRDGAALVADASDGRVLANLSGAPANPAFVHLGADGDALLVAEPSGAIRVWARGAHTPRTLRSPVWAGKNNLQVDELPMRAALREARFLPGGRVLTVAANGRAAIWDARSGTRAAVVTNPSPAARLRIYPDRLLASSGDHLLTTWDLSRAWPTDRWLHTAPVADFAVIGERIVSADAGGRVYLRPLDGGPVTRIDTAVASQSARLITAAGARFVMLAGAGKAAIIDLQAGAPAGDFAYDASLPNAVLADRGHVALRLTRENTRLFDLATGQPGGTLRLSYAARPMALDAQAGRLVTVAFEQVAEVWNIDTLRKHFTAIADAPVTRLRLLGAGAWLLADTRTGGTLWSLAGRAQIRTFDADQPLSAFDFHDASGNLAIAGPGYVRVVRLSDGAQRGLWPATGAAKRLLFDPSGRHLAWIADDGLALATLGDKQSRRTGGQRGDIDDIAFSDDGRRLYVARADKRVRVIDTETAALTGEAKHWDRVERIFADGNQGFISVTASGAANRWSSADLTVTRRAEHHSSVAAAGVLDGRLTSFAGARTPITAVVDSQDGAVLGRVPLARDAITNYAVSADKRLLATAGRDTATTVWNLGRGESLFTTGPFEAFVAARTQSGAERPWWAFINDIIANLGGGASRPRSIAKTPLKLLFSADGQTLAISRPRGQTVTVRPATGASTVIASTPGDLIGFSLDGQRLLFEDDTGQVVTRDPSGGENPATRQRRLPVQPLVSSAELVQEKQFRRYVDGKSEASSAARWRDTRDIYAIDPNHSRLLIRDAKGLLGVADARDGTAIAKMPASRGMRDAHFSTGGGYALARDGQSIHIWPLYQQPAREAAQAILERLGS